MEPHTKTKIINGSASLRKLCDVCCFGSQNCCAPRSPRSPGAFRVCAVRKWAIEKRGFEYICWPFTEITQFICYLYSNSHYDATCDICMRLCGGGKLRIRDRDRDRRWMWPYVMFVVEHVYVVHAAASAKTTTTTTSQ